MPDVQCGSHCERLADRPLLQQDINQKLQLFGMYHGKPTSPILELIVMLRVAKPSRTASSHRLVEISPSDPMHP